VEIKTMPFCSNCGKFSVSLTQQKLCSACKKLEFEGKISEEHFRQQQSRLSNDAGMSLLHYRSESGLQQSQSDPSHQPHLVEEPYLQNQETPAFQQKNVEPEGGREGWPNLALGLVLIGYLLLFLGFVVFSGVINVCGLIAAFIAKRSELTRNWRPQVALGVGIIFWAVFILYNVIKLAGF